MCGIVGYIGKGKANEIILKGLKRLEYRGYDSAGISVLINNEIRTLKRSGKLNELIAAEKKSPLLSNIGIGHTRWATHGEPNEINAHPHISYDGKFSVVHNGIIENYKELKENLEKDGIKFKSNTDTEVIAHLIAKNYEIDKDFLKAVAKTVKKLKGAYGLGILCNEEKRLIAVRNSSPLVFGIASDGFLISSDITPILEYTKDIIYLDDDNIVDITTNKYKIYNSDLAEIKKEITKVNLSIDAASKDGYDHYLIKEISEQPRAILDAISRKLNDDEIVFEDGSLIEEELKKIDKIYITACGTAYHAGQVGKFLIEKFCNRPVITEIASEFRYENLFVNEKSLVIFVSQSGETADTLAALRKAKSLGAKTLAITNVVGSSIAREADKVIYCYAGPEISVASTKAYTTQVISFIFLALDMALKTNKMTKEEIKKVIAELKTIPEKVQKIINNKEFYKKIADEIKNKQSIFYTGRGLDFITAKEGALKLKEISYIHTEAFQSGELKHGSMALIEAGTCVISVATQEHVFEKTSSNNEELKARGAKVYEIVFEGAPVKDSTSVVKLPKTMDILSPLLAVIPEQLIAYYTSALLGNDVDKPRNLAKAVTVE